MPDSLATLPDDDENPLVLLQDAIEFYEGATGVDLSDLGDGVRAVLAANADENAALWAVVRELVDDWARDLGRLFGVPDPQPVPALALTSWTARPDRDGILLPGQEIVVDAEKGLFAFEVLTQVDVPAGQTVTGIWVQALTAGSAANGATGPVQLDVKPAWVQDIQVTEPAAGGEDEISPAEHLERCRRAFVLQSDAPVNDTDVELRLLDVPNVARALVLDNYDLESGEDDVEGVLTVWPLDADGEGLATSPVLGGAITKQRIEAAISGPGRRRINGVTYFGSPAYAVIGGHVKYSIVPDYDPDVADDLVLAAFAAALSPALHGQPRRGQLRRWRRRKYVRKYEISAALNNVDPVVEVVELTLTVASGSPATITPAGDVLLSGIATLPRPNLTAGAITSEIVEDE